MCDLETNEIFFIEKNMFPIESLIVSNYHIMKTHSIDSWLVCRELSLKVKLYLRSTFEIIEPEQKCSVTLSGGALLYLVVFWTEYVKLTYHLTIIEGKQLFPLT